MAVLIPISSGKAFAIIDECDFDEISKYKWRLHSGGYAIRNGKRYIKNGKKSRDTIYMHGLLNKTADGLQTDHINGNRLDNRRENLRSVTPKQNQMNKKVSKHSLSGIKGIRKCRATGKWRVSMSVNGKYLALGRTPCLGKAIKIYNQNAIKHHGEYAKLNGSIT